MEGTDYHTWATEPFLFFVNAKGEPSPKTMAGDYAAIGDFDYDYDRGSGEGVVAVPMAAMAPADMGAKIERLDAEIKTSPVSEERGGGVLATLPRDALRATEGQDAPKLFAKVTLALPPLAHPGDLSVVVNSTPDAAGVATSSPQFAGTLSMFGHHNIQGPVTWLVPLSDAVHMLSAGPESAAPAELNVRVVDTHAPAGDEPMQEHGGEPKAVVLSITLEAH